MKKLTMFIFSLLLALSVPMLAAAHEMDHHAGHGMHCADKDSCCDGDSSQCMKHDKGARDMRGMRGGVGELGREVMSKMPGCYLRHSDELKLSDDQVASLKKISSDMKKDMVTK